MTKLQCIVERITYQNSDNGFTIMKVKVKDYNEQVTLVGSLLDIPVGSVLLCEGDWKIDKHFDSQFVVKSWEEVMPATALGIEKYLSSELVKGIGKKFTQYIQLFLFQSHRVSILSNLVFHTRMAHNQ